MCTHNVVKFSHHLSKDQIQIHLLMLKNKVITLITLQNIVPMHLHDILLQAVAKCFNSISKHSNKFQLIKQNFYRELESIFHKLLQLVH